MVGPLPRLGMKRKTAGKEYKGERQKREKSRWFHNKEIYLVIKHFEYKLMIRQPGNEALLPD
jgi:hypothetical protein